jgi:hypothetical protein
MLNAVLGFAGLTLRSLGSGKRAWAAAVALALPALLALAAAGRAPAEAVYRNVVFYYSLWFLPYLLGILYGISLSSGEIEDGTAGYLYLSRLPKWLIALLRMGVAAGALTAGLSASLLLTALAAGGLAHPARDVLSCTLVGGAAILIALAWSTACGFACRTPMGAMAAAILPVFFWELMVSWWRIKFAAWTVTNNLRALLLVLLFEGRRGPQFRYEENFRLPDYGEAALFLSALAGILLALAMVAAMNRSIEGKEAR